MSKRRQHARAVARAARLGDEHEAAELGARNKRDAATWDIADPHPFVCKQAPVAEGVPRVVRTTRVIKRRGGINDGEILAMGVSFPAAWLEPSEIASYLASGALEYVPAQRRAKAA